MRWSWPAYIHRPWPLAMHRPNWHEKPIISRRSPVRIRNRSGPNRLELLKIFIKILEKMFFKKCLATFYQNYRNYQKFLSNILARSPGGGSVTLIPLNECYCGLCVKLCEPNWHWHSRKTYIYFLVWRLNHCAFAVSYLSVIIQWFSLNSAKFCCLARSCYINSNSQ